MKKHGRKSQSRTIKPPDREFLPDIDLHDIHPDLALEAMEIFIEQAYKDGLRKILVIHGKGIRGDGTGTLRRRVRARLRQNKYVVEIKPAEQYQGGDGATIVILK
jgi:DNA mismatch repair protein MutS2